MATVEAPSPLVAGWYLVTRCSRPRGARGDAEVAEDTEKLLPVDSRTCGQYYPAGACSDTSLAPSDYKKSADELRRSCDRPLARRADHQDIHALTDQREALRLTAGQAGDTCNCCPLLDDYRHAPAPTNLGSTD